MTKEKLWQLYCERNPSLLTDEPKINICKFFNVTYEAGYQQAMNEMVNECGKRFEDSDRELPNVLKDLFTGKKLK